MKKICIFIFVIAVAAFSFSIAATANTSFITSKNFDQTVTSSILEKLGNETHSVVSAELIKDFANSTYTLYHLSPIGYIIVDENSKQIVEASFKSESPYDSYSNIGYKYYLGPLNYFIQEGNKYYSIRDNEKIDFKDELKEASKQLKNNLKEKSISSTIKLTSTSLTTPGNGAYVDISGWTLINNNNYFRQLNYFPENNDGTCGLVSLSMILGYLDTFYNDNTIPNIPINVDGVSSSLIVKGSTYNNLNANNLIPVDLWYRSPGTPQALHDLLFNYGNYYHYDGPDPFDWINDGYAVTSGQIYETFADYRDDYISSSYRPYYEITYGLFFETHVSAMNLINEGVPVNLTMESYIYDTTKSGTWHDVVAYGYKDGMFLTHFGWSPRIPGSYLDGSITPYAETIVNSAVIQSYVGISYTGAIIKSRNVSIIGLTNVYVAGDGTIMYPTTSSC